MEKSASDRVFMLMTILGYKELAFFSLKKNENVIYKYVEKINTN